MSIVNAIGFVSSIITIEEAGRSWLKILKDFRKNDSFDLDKFDSEDAIVQSWIDKFKTQMSSIYKEHIFSDTEIAGIVTDFFEQNSDFHLNYEDRHIVTQFIETIMHSYNEYVQQKMSVGEKIIYGEIDKNSSKILEQLQLIQEQPQHENIKRFLKAIERSKQIELANIDDRINGEYEISRAELIDKIQSEAYHIVSIQGCAGVGKSVLCKKILRDKEYVLATRAESFVSGKKMDEIWGCDVEEAVKWLDGKSLYLFIDAIEFIADCGTEAFNAIQEIFRLADKYDNVFVFTTCRTSDSSAFIRINTKYEIVIYDVSELSDKEIDNISAKYSIIAKLNKQEKYRDLLKIPFYINLIVSGDFNEEGINNENSFRHLIWKKVICLEGKAKRYGVNQSSIRNTIDNIVFTRAKKFVVGIDKDNIDSDVLDALLSEGIIICSEDKVRLKYDIFEDICFEVYFDKKFDDCRGDYINFFEQIKNIGRCVYRRYQIWIANKLFLQDSRQKFVYSLLISKDIDEEWKKQTEIGIVKSKYCGLFFEEFCNLLDEEALNELISITNLYAFEARIINSPLLTLKLNPVGAARKNILLIVSRDFYSDKKHKSALIKLCDDYSRCVDKKEDAERKASEILIYYVKELMEEDKTKGHWGYSKDIVALFLIISRLASVSKGWLTEFVSERIEEYIADNHGMRSLGEEVLNAILTNQDADFVRELPDLACKVADTFWAKHGTDCDSLYYSPGLYQEDNFGLSRNVDHLNDSSLGVFSNTFIWYIVRYDFLKGFNWAISFINRAISFYADNKPEEVKKIIIYFPDNKTTKEYYANESMWVADSMEYSIPVVLTDYFIHIKENYY